MATVHKAHGGTALTDLLRSPNLPVLLIAAAVVVGLAALLPLVQSSEATSRAGTVHQLEQEKADWQARLRELELDVATLGSLNRIEQEATKRLKMGPPKEVHYISVDVAPPQERKLPSRFLPSSREQKNAGSSLWEDAFGWLPLP